LNQFVDLNQHIHCHFEFGARSPSAFNLLGIMWEGIDTIFGVNDTLAHMLERAGKARTWLQHYDTTT
jgi:hypothetical protein